MARSLRLGRFLPFAVAAVVLLGSSWPVPAVAEDDVPASFTSTPTATAGGSIEVRSDDPCPPRPEPTDDTTVVKAHLVRWSGRSFWESYRPAAADGSWSWTINLPADVRNGRYLVAVTCESARRLSADGRTTISEPYHAYEPNQLVITSSPGGSDPVTRLAGSDRIATAVAISKDVFSGAAEGAVVARSDTYADSLAGGPLAGLVGGPLLLTGGAALDPRVSDELDRLATAGGGTRQGFPVYLLGGTAAISQTVQDQLLDRGYDVQRVGGLNRFGTAARIAREWYGDVGQILLADGNDFHDGLVAAAASRSEFAWFGRSILLLTDGAKLPPETSGVLAENPDAKLTAVGSQASKAVPSAYSLVGDGYAGTALRVADDMFGVPTVVSLANESSYSDALTGGLHAALTGGPLLWTGATSLPPAVDSFLRTDHLFIVAGYAYGGTSAISEALRQRAQQDIAG